MIDRQAMANDLQQARQARIEAQAANSDVEELSWQVQHVQLSRQRVVFSIAGFDQEPDGPAN
jgi:Tfp pilus assembly protein PilV